MTDLYQGILQKAQKSLKKRYISVICVGVAALCTLIVCTCCVTYFNKAIITVTNVAISVLAGWFVYGSFSLPIAILHSYMRICQRIARGKRVTVNGIVKDFSYDTVTIDNLRYISVTVQKDDLTLLFMLDASFAFPKLEKGGCITLFAVDKYIVGFDGGAQGAD